MTTPPKAFSSNNFDLIRLFAAMQVALVHGLLHLQPLAGALRAADYLELVPGVPVFFLVSGFLISRSYENSMTLGQYCRNRILRIYPALWLCVFSSTLAVFMVGFLHANQLAGAPLWLWVAGQGSFVQFYNPEFMRAFGDGVLNGSLWTISVELQFYLLVPLLYRFVLNRFERKKASCVLLGVTILFGVGNQIHHTHTFGVLADKFIEVSFLPWFYMFLAGVWCQWNWDRVRGWFTGRACLFAPAYVMLAAVLKYGCGFATGNKLGPVVFLLLAGTVMACAYSAPALSERWLRRNDLSYGIYIYHMPVINTLIFLGWAQRSAGVAAAAGMTLALAAGSWMLIERPCLRLKRRTVHPVD